MPTIETEQLTKGFIMILINFNNVSRNEWYMTTLTHKVIRYKLADIIEIEAVYDVFETEVLHWTIETEEAFEGLKKHCKNLHVFTKIQRG